MFVKVGVAVCVGVFVKVGVTVGVAVCVGVGVGVEQILFAVTFNLTTPLYGFV